MTKLTYSALFLVLLAVPLYAQVNLGGAVTVGGSAGAGTGTVTHQKGSLVTGQPIAAQGAADVNTSPRFQDSHIHDVGNDMSQAILATWTDCIASAGPGGASSCAVKAGYTGYQFWSVNPLASGINGGDLDLCSAGVTDIRVGNGSSPLSIVVREGQHIHGCGQSSLNQAPGSNYHNTIIRACNPLFMTGPGTYGAAPCSAFFVPSAQITASACTTTVCSFTNSAATQNSLSVGQDVFIYNDAVTPDANAITNHMMVATRVDNTHFTVAYSGPGVTACASAATPSTCGTMYEGTPVVRQANLASFISEIDHLIIDGGWVRGAIPYVNATGEEQTLLHDANLVNFGGEAMRISNYRFSSSGSDPVFQMAAYGATSGSLGAINSGPYRDIHIHFMSETCELLAGCPGGVGVNTSFDGTLTLPQVVNCSTFGILADGNKNANVRGFFNMTIDPSVSTAGNPGLAPQLRSTGWTGGTSCGSTNAPGVGSAFAKLVFGMNTLFSSNHIEYMPTGYELGGNATLNAYWPGNPGTNNTLGASVVMIENEEICTSGTTGSHGGCNPDANYAIDIGSGSDDITILNLQNTSDWTINDNVTGQQCSGTTSRNLAKYILGQGNPPYLDTSCPGISLVPFRVLSPTNPTIVWGLQGFNTANASILFTAGGGSKTLNITGAVAGGNYVLKVQQASSGVGEGLILGSGCTWKVSGGGAGAITPSTANNAIDILVFTYDGTNCLANFTKNFN